MSLHRRVIWVQSALIAALVVGVAAYAEFAVYHSAVARFREQLLREADLVENTLADGGDVRQGPALGEQVARIAAALGERVTVVGPDGLVWADSEADPAFMGPHDTRPEIVMARSSGSGWALRRSATLSEEMLYVARCSGADRPTIRLALPARIIGSVTAGLRSAVGVAAVALGIAAVLVGIWLARSVTRPLTDLSRVAERIAQGQGSRATEEGPDEIRAVARSLNAMAEALSGAVERERRSGAYLESVLAQMADGVIVVTAQEAVSYVSPRAAAMLSLEPDQALNRPLMGATLHYELGDLVRRALRLRTPFTREIVTQEDTPKTLTASASPFYAPSAEVEGVIVTLRDTTEQRRLQRLRQEFVANASHELRTPVAAIRSLAEALDAGAVRDEQLSAQFVSSIVQNSDSLTRLLADMLALARLEEPQDPSSERASVDVAGALREAVARLEPLAEAKGVGMAVEAPAGLTAWCAEHRLMAALVNLVDNAVKYSPEGGLVSLHGEGAGDAVRITVTDAGPGIPASARERVFERFYRVDKGRSRALGGTGLGLSIVRHAVEADLGRVWVEAADGGGTRMVVLLPALPAPPETADPAGEASPEP